MRRPGPRPGPPPAAGPPPAGWRAGAPPRTRRAGPASGRPRTRRPPAVGSVGRALLRALGPQGWWPADTAEEMIIGAVLTQAVAWDNAARAIARLKAARLCHLAALAACRPQDLAPLIRPAGYFNAKARKLVAVAAFFATRGGVEALRRVPAAEVRRDLLGVYGVGPETADAILCYALGHPAFVADAYARRVLGRIGTMPAEAARSYRGAAAWAARHVRGDASWVGELHALLVAVGKSHCRRRRPLCAGCPAAAFCAHASAAGGA